MNLPLLFMPIMLPSILTAMVCRVTATAIFYLSRKVPTTNGVFRKILGFPINTIENEGSLFVAADGITAFYASDRSDTRGELDIYTFELRPDVRPAKTLYVKGKVYDVKTGKGLPSAVELIDNSTQKQ